jgi:hypothetical protein
LAQVVNPSQHRAVMGSDLIVLVVEGPMQLRRVAPLCKYLAPGGLLWLLHNAADTEAVMRSVAEADLVALESAECVLSPGGQESREKIALCVSPRSASS